MTTRSKDTTPLLVVQSAETGDYFRIWPDGRAVELHEDELRYPSAIADMQPTRRDTARLWKPEQGERFWRCVEWPCTNCNGGEDRPLVTEPDDDHGYRSEYRCDECENEGFTLGTRSGDPDILRSELPYDAEAVAAFKPIPLNLCADYLVDLRGAA